MNCCLPVFLISDSFLIKLIELVTKGSKEFILIAKVLFPIQNEYILKQVFKHLSS